LKVTDTPPSVVGKGVTVAGVMEDASWVPKIATQVKGATAVEYDAAFTTP